MQDLINIKNDEAVTTSLLIAEYFHKRHDHVLRAIENLMAGLPKNGVSYFHKGKYTDASGKNNLMYYMNRDGFSLLAMGFTGKKALEWKIKYIEAFNQMETYISIKKADIQIQKNTMQFLCDNLEMPTKQDYIKANTIANKAVSNLFGYPKMIKKDEMSAEMLEAREPILQDTATLMAVKDKYDLDIAVAENIYKKHKAVI